MTYLVWFFSQVYILMANSSPDPGKFLSMHLTLSRWSDPWNSLFFASLWFKQPFTVHCPKPCLSWPDCKDQKNTSPHWVPSALHQGAAVDVLQKPAGLLVSCWIAFRRYCGGSSLWQGLGWVNMRPLLPVVWKWLLLDQADHSKHPPPHLRRSSAL